MGLTTGDLPSMPDLGISPLEFFGVVEGKNKGKCEQDDNNNEQADVRIKSNISPMSFPAGFS